MSKDITITQANNTVFVINEGMVQANNNNVDLSKTYTYAIGVFLDGVLVSVRNYSVRYSRSNQYDFFSINTLFKNLSVGTHSIKPMFLCPRMIILRPHSGALVSLWRVQPIQR